jgi:hypothetical protein
MVPHKTSKAKEYAPYDEILEFYTKARNPNQQHSWLANKPLYGTLALEVSTKPRRGAILVAHGERPWVAEQD